MAIPLKIRMPEVVLEIWASCLFSRIMDAFMYRGRNSLQYQTTNGLGVIYMYGWRDRAVDNMDIFNVPAQKDLST